MAGATRERLVPKRGCPICGRPQMPAYTPFCSKRCADIDLSRWLKGSYVIPVTDEDDEGQQPHRPSESDED